MVQHIRGKEKWIILLGAWGFFMSLLFRLVVEEIFCGRTIKNTEHFFALLIKNLKNWMVIS